MPDSKWTKPNRLTEVISTDIREEIVGSFPGYSLESLASQIDVENLRDGDTVWTVWTKYLTGMDRKTYGAAIFASRAEAESAAQKMPVGTKFGDGFGFPKRFKDLFEGQDATKIMSYMFSTGDDDAVDFTCYEAFFESGVDRVKFGGLSEKVVQWLGDEHIHWMREEFGENWEAVARLEYVMNHFPDSSLVGLAAKLFFAKFVTYDDFATGYLVKELEAVIAGTEEKAMAALEAQSKRIKASGEKSAKAKLERLEAFMCEVEGLADLAGRISERAILDQAWLNLSSYREDTPKTLSTRQDYETAVRCDPPFMDRYHAVFAKSA